MDLRLVERRLGLEWNAGQLIWQKGWRMDIVNYPN
jgi:hypothetical protein